MEQSEGKYRCDWCGLLINTPHSYQLLSNPEIRLHATCLDRIWEIAYNLKQLIHSFTDYCKRRAPNILEEATLIQTSIESGQHPGLTMQHS